MTTQRVTVALTIVNLGLLAVLVGGATSLSPSRSAVAATPSRASTSATQEVPIVRTRRLEIVDERGQVRSRINVEADGQVVLRMTDRGGAIRVKLGADEGGSGLVLLDEATEPGVQIAARRTGTEAQRATSLTLRAGRREQVIKP